MIMKYRVGDEVILSVEDDFGHKEKTKKQVKVQILATNATWDNVEYLCYLPPYFTVKDAFRITEKHLKFYSIPKKFLNDNAMFINETTQIVKHVPTTPGELCDRCKAFIPWAVKVESYIHCRACKENPWR